MRPTSLRCRRRGARRRWLCCGVLGIALLAGGCETTQRTLHRAGLPWTRAPFRVAAVTPHGPYLDVRLSGDDTRRVLARDTGTCRTVFEVGTEVTLGQGGATGIAHRGDASCELVGIGDLDGWRLSRGIRRYGESPIVRSTTRIAIVGRDAQYLYLRGGFGLAGRFQWSPGTDKVIALVPRGGHCESLADGFVDVLFRQTGTPALGISRADGTCPIEAVAADVPDAFREGPAAP